MWILCPEFEGSFITYILFKADFKIIEINVLLLCYVDFLVIHQLKNQDLCSPANFSYFSKKCWKQSLNKETHWPVCPPLKKWFATKHPSMLITDVLGNQFMEGPLNSVFLLRKTWCGTVANSPSSLTKWGIAQWVALHLAHYLIAHWLCDPLMWGRDVV